MSHLACGPCFKTVRTSHDVRDIASGRRNGCGFHKPLKALARRRFDALADSDAGDCHYGDSPASQADCYSSLSRGGPELAATATAL